MNPKQMSEGRPYASATHIPGPFICIDGRVIQRCMVCGYKLTDSRGKMAPDLHGTGAVTTFEANTLVRVTEWDFGRRWEVVQAPAGYYPADGCIDLVEL